MDYNELYNKYLKLLVENQILRIENMYMLNVGRTNKAKVDIRQYVLMSG